MSRVATLRARAEEQIRDEETAGTQGLYLESLLTRQGLKLTPATQHVMEHASKLHDDFGFEHRGFNFALESAQLQSLNRLLDIMRRRVESALRMELGVTGEMANNTPVAGDNYNRCKRAIAMAELPRLDMGAQVSLGNALAMQESLEVLDHVMKSTSTGAAGQQQQDRAFRAAADKRFRSHITESLATAGQGFAYLSSAYGKYLEKYGAEITDEPRQLLDDAQKIAAFAARHAQAKLKDRAAVVDLP